VYNAVFCWLFDTTGVQDEDIGIVRILDPLCSQ